uniref:Uncharacterized protein n=1 Tax=Cacopsylla melanoneura TaxID=428564 RepID=A0A8D8RQG9_9HEMI
MMKVTLVGLVIATVVDLSLGQGAAWIIINLAMFRPIDLSLGQGGIAPWTKESEQYLEKFKALNLPNPVCKVNTDCDPVKGVVIGIVDAKYTGNSKISQDCSCIKPDLPDSKCSCKVTFQHGNIKGIQTYYEQVFFTNGTNHLEAQYVLVLPS